MEWSLPPLPRLAEMRTGKRSSLGIVSLINIILYLYVVLDVCAGGNGRHVARRKLLQLFGLKRVGSSLPPDGFCPLRAHPAHWYLPRNGGVILLILYQYFPTVPWCGCSNLPCNGANDAIVSGGVEL